MLDSGVSVVDVSKIAGHSTPSITLDAYGHQMNDGMAAAEAIGAALGTAR
jgi:integrase